jgi:hypothetical protein
MPGAVDLAGAPVDPFAQVGPRGLVLLFVRTDCPISNRYAPRLQDLAETFAPRGLAFFLVFPEDRTPPAAIRRHVGDFGYRLPVLRDPGHTLVTRSGAQVTPEAAVFDPAGTLVYRGRIDDRYRGLGQARPAATGSELEEVLEELAADRPVAARFTPAVGCRIEAPR